MSDEKLNTDWVHTASLLSLLANAHSAKNQRFKPSHFPSPFKPVKQKKESIDALKIFVR